jgi:hypothetical protein
MFFPVNYVSCENTECRAVIWLYILALYYNDITFVSRENLEVFVRERVGLCVMKGMLYAFAPLTKTNRQKDMFCDVTPCRMIEI